MVDIYQPRIRPRVAMAAPAAGPDLSIARGVAEVGGAVGRLAELEAEREFDRQAADAQLRWAELQRDYGLADNQARAEPAAPGAQGHRETMDKLAQKQVDDFMAGISDPRLMQKYEVRVAEWRAARTVEADEFEGMSTAKLNVDRLSMAVDIMVNEARTATPARLAEMVADIETIEVPGGVSGDVAMLLRRQAVAEVNASWLRGQEPEQRLALLNSGLYDTMLKPEQMEALRNGAEVDVRRKKVEAEAVARAAKAEAVEQVDDVLDRIGRGYPVTDEEYAAAYKTAEDHGLTKRTRDLADAFVGKQVNQEYATATPAQIDARIKLVDAELAKAGDKADPKMVAERAALASLLTTRTAEVNKDPLGAGARMGIDVQPIDWSNPASIAARRKAAEATGKALGVPPRYLTDEEAAQMSSNAGTPAGQLLIAGQLRALGPTAATAAARQVAPGDDMFAYSVGLRPEIQQAIYRGKALRKEFPVPLKDAQETWREVTGNAMRHLPAASREAAYLSAVEIYRQAASSKGKDEFDATLFRGAVREALGGTVAGRLGGVGEWNDVKIMLPSDMSQSMFDARMAGFTPTRAHRADKSKIPAAEFRARFTPVLQANGKYRFVSARGEYVVIEDGRTALEVDIRKVKPKAPAPKYTPGSTGAFWGAPPGSMKDVKPVVPKGPQPRASGV